MSLYMRGIYLALQGPDCAVTRGWPQALIPLPAIAISSFTDSLDEAGQRRFAVDLPLRAATPEGADSLAQETEEALSAAPMEIDIQLGGVHCTARLISMRCRRRLLDIAGGDDRCQRLTVAGEEYSRLKIRLPGSLLAAAQAQYALGEALMAGGRKALIEGISLVEGEAEVSLCHRL